MGSVSQVETAFILPQFLGFQGKNLLNKKNVGKTVSLFEFPISIFSASSQHKNAVSSGEESERKSILASWSN